MFKCNNKPKFKSKLNKKKNGSSQTVMGGRGGDIRTFLKPIHKPRGAELETDRQTNSPPPSATEVMDLGPELSKSEIKSEQRGGLSVPRLRTVLTPDRKGESGVTTWDPAIKSSSSKLLFTHALPSVPSAKSSEQAQ